ncbi:MAG: EAL domain-containing protein [Acidimicrobiia bacterium]|nr:EAL domain-containing protein [Acidimicrobiia bacterium]
MGDHGEQPASPVPPTAIDLSAAATSVATLGAPVDAQILTHLRDAVVLVDAEGVVSYVSPNAPRILGRDVAELMGKPVTSCFAERDVGAIERVLRRPPDASGDMAALLFGDGLGPWALFADTPRRLGPPGTRFLTFRPTSADPVVMSDIEVTGARLADPPPAADFDPVAAAELEAAIELGQFEVHYQPEVDLETSTVIGAEALVRWIHPDRGIVPAGEFIELAESCGLIRRLGRSVLEEACRHFGEWTRRFGDAALTLRVNLSADQLSDPDVIDLVVGSLEHSATAPESLCVEVTETVLMQDPRSLDVLHELQLLGIGVAIDDFGTGYSSLSQLKRLPVDVLKIDRSFVDGLGHTVDDAAIVRAIVELARAIGLGVVAEGIEHPRQADELLRLGCRRGQGWLFGRAMPWAELEYELLRP